MYKIIKKTFIIITILFFISREKKIKTTKVDEVNISQSFASQDNFYLPTSTTNIIINHNFYTLSYS